jgi:hypothetical protein
VFSHSLTSSFFSPSSKLLSKNKKIKTSGVTLGDSIVIDFDMETEGDGVLDDAGVRSTLLLEGGDPSSPLSLSLDVILAGVWLDRGKRLEISLSQGSITSSFAESIRVGALSVAVRDGALLRSRDLSSDPMVGETKTFMNRGSYGDSPTDVRAKLMTANKIQVSFCPPTNNAEYSSHPDPPGVDVRLRQVSFLFLALDDIIFIYMRRH